MARLLQQQLSGAARGGPRIRICHGGVTVERVGHAKPAAGESRDTPEEGFPSTAREPLRPPRRLIASDAQLGRVVRHAPVVLFALDSDGTLAVYEGQGLDALSPAPADLVGQSIFELAACRPDVVQGARRALAGEALTSIVPVGARTIEVRWAPVVSNTGAVASVTGVAVDVTERVAESRQQAAVAELWHWVVQGASLPDLLNAAVHTIARVLGAPFARVLDFLPSGDGVRVSAAYGWPAEAIGAVERHPIYQEALRNPARDTDALMVPDWRTELRYRLPAELRARGIVSSLTVPILVQSGTRLQGFVSVYATAPRVFTDGEATFLRSITRLLSDVAPRISAAEAERTVLYGDVIERLDRLQEIVARLVSSQERSQRAMAAQMHGKQLTYRELQILRLVAEGWSNREIGVELALASGTVKNHVARILTKLDVTDRTQAAVRGLDLGLIQPRP